MAPDLGSDPGVEVDKWGERGGEGREVRAYTHNSFSETDFGDSVQCLFPRLDLASVHGGRCRYHLPTLA